MRGILVVGVVAMLSIGGAVALGDSDSERRTAAKAKQSNPTKRPLADRLEDSLRTAKAAKVRCRTIKCVNTSLTNLAKDVKVLVRETFKCERWVNVTQYYGYQYSDGASVFPTTALDYTEEGGTVSDRVLVYVC